MPDDRPPLTARTGLRVLVPALLGMARDWLADWWARRRAPKAPPPPAPEA